MTTLQPRAVAPGCFRGYLELLRLPNLFTAAADVLMGYWVTQEGLAGEGFGLLGSLVAASVLLYAAGVVLNDVFDAEVDARERPSRPIPSGRVAFAAARSLGWGLLLLGAALGWLAGYLAGSPRPGVVASLLAGCIVLYNGYLKRTPIGPVAMGACRALNVLVGMSAMVGPWHTWHLLIAGGVGVYVAGVTLFAKEEAVESSRSKLSLGILVMLAGVAMVAWYPRWLPLAGPPLQIEPFHWYLAWTVLGLWFAWQCMQAVIEPQPLVVQGVVRQRILSLIFLDAIACFGVAGQVPAILVVALLIPTMLLGQFIRST